jgi:hypothetical protein
MAELGPGLRREDEDGRIALNHLYVQALGAPRLASTRKIFKQGLPVGEPFGHCAR